MGHGMQVHDRAELEGERKGALSLDHSREAATIALADKPGFDVAELSEDEFNAGLRRIKVRQQRMQAVIDTVMVPGVHYLTHDKNGNKIFDKPHMTIAGGAELRNFFRLTCKPIEAPEIVASEKLVSVTVTVGCFDTSGRLLGSRTGACNTMEKRFQKRGGGWIYADAREMTHQCTTMAEKRGASLITKEVTGAVAFFAAEEEMDKALAAEQGEEEPKKKPGPWTKDEETLVKAAAKEAGMSKRRELKELIRATLGRGFVGTGEDVARLMAAIGDKKRGVTPVRDGGEGYGEEPAPAPGQRTAEDAQADLQLAGEGQERMREPGEEG